MLQTAKKFIYPPLGIIVILVAWHVGCVQFNIPTVVLPRPALVLDALVTERQLLLAQGWMTLQECVYGFLLAFALGVPIAVAIANSQLLNLTFSPILVALQSVPKVALAPIVLVWFGLGIESKLAMVWLVAFFPIVVDTAAGLRATPHELLDLARALRASPLQIFAKVQFPAALPFVLAGSKVAVTLAVIGAVIGEFVGSTAGLGNLLLAANSQINTPLAWAALFTLALLGLLMYGLVALLERLLAPWIAHTTQKG